MYNLKSFTNLNTVSENELLVQKLRNIFKLTVCFIYPPTTLLEAKPLPRLSILATDPDVQSTAVIQLNLHGIRSSFLRLLSIVGQIGLFQITGIKAGQRGLHRITEFLNG